MPNLVTDSNGIPSPQYLKRDGTAYEALRGADGRMDVNVVELASLPAGTNNIGKVNVLSLPSLPSGANLIGKIQTEPTTTITKYLASCNALEDNILWSPESGRAIILKGIRIQNITEVVASVATGLGIPDAIVTLKFGTTTVMTLRLQGKQFLSDTVEKIFIFAGNFEAETLLFGEGLKLAVDTPIKINPNQVSVTATAWGYEV